jgi:hypothetical protein
MGILDPAVSNAQFVKLRGLLLQLGPIAAGEGNVVQTSAVLIEGVCRALRMGVQPEQLPTVECEDRVVKAPASSSSSSTGSDPNSRLYQRVLRSRSVTVTAM